MNVKQTIQKYNPFKTTEKKSFDPSIFSNASYSFADYLGSTGYSDLAAAECIRLYKKCNPLFTAINMRAEAFSSIPLRVYNTKTKKFEDSHPVLELLKNPNGMQSGSSFLKWYSMFYDICGEAYIIATGDQNKEPLELLPASPVSITIRPTREWNTIGYAGSYFLSTVNGTANYQLEEMKYGNRYWNAAGDQEIWQTKEFNPSQSANNLRGLSKASPLWLQIQQFIEADQNNYSILVRGGRPSLAWIWGHEEAMTDEQYQRWKEQVKAYEGSLNAGRQIILDKMSLQDLGMNNKDMEFSVNRKTVKEDIYGTYFIPLPLVSSSEMTLDNLATSMTMFYDLSVLPLADNLLDDLTRFLMPRYKNSESLILKYNENDISVLKERAIERAAKLAKLYILTDDEIRTTIGYDKIEGGDQVYKTTTIYPASAGLPVPVNPDTTFEASKARTAYTEQLRGLKSAGSGKRIFSDEAVEKMADDMGLN